jgi:hypothetical protein
MKPTSDGPTREEQRPLQHANNDNTIDVISDNNTLLVIGALALIAWLADYLKVFTCSC